MDRKPASSRTAASPPLPAGPPTSYDVAERAGVSQSAVSRCFRPGASISPKMRERVLRAARELGYQPNAIAAGLITRRSNLVAVLISSLTNLHYPEVLAELTRQLSERGIRVLLFALQAESDVTAMLDQMWRYRIDGAIVAAHLAPPLLKEFARRRVPLVLYNRHDAARSAPSVCCDSTGGEQQLVDRLLAAGHRRFGIIAGPEDSFVSRERVEAVCQRLRAAGHEPAVAGGAFDYESGRAGMAALMEMTEGTLDAVVCVNDLMAIGAIDAARDLFGRQVPDSLSVVGFDGVGPASWSAYGLTTVRQPVQHMAEAAVAMLAARIADPDTPPEARTFSGRLIEGKSARL